MKSLKTYLEDLFATPSNTIGIGNPSLPTEPNVEGGSGDIPLSLCKKQNRKRKLKFKRYKIV